MSELEQVSEAISAEVGTQHDPVVMAESFREKLKEFEKLAREFSDILKSPNAVPMFDKGECIAQSILALRHLEDARMRYGKVIQYATTGESNYQK